MARNNARINLALLLGTAAISLLLLSSCGAFGGRYKIAEKTMSEHTANGKIPIDVKLVLDPELCEYVYISKRQGAKRVYELGHALCSNSKNLFAYLFNDVIVVSSKGADTESKVDAVAMTKVIDTSVLVRPGAPPTFEAALIFECSMEDPIGRPIFVRTLKEYKILKQYGSDSYRSVMQSAVDDLFTQLGNEMVRSPEINRYADSLK